MRNFSAVIERDSDTGVFVGFVPGFPGALSQGATLDELNANLREVMHAIGGRRTRSRIRVCWGAKRCDRVIRGKRRGTETC